MKEQLKDFLPIGTEIEIITFNKREEDNILFSSVYSIQDDNKKMIISNPINKGEYYTLSNFGQYYFRFYVNNIGVFLFKGKIIKNTRYDNLPSYEIAIDSPIKKVQRRRFYRVQREIDGFFNIENKKDLKKISPNMKKKYLNDDIIEEEFKMIKIPFLALDISGGGIRVKSKNFSLSLNQRVKGELSLDDELVYFVGKVVRVLDIEGEAEYAISFENLNETMRSRIISYIFEYERNILKRRMESSE